MTKREARAAKSEKELLLDLHDRLDELDTWREGVDRRLAEGDTKFGHLGADTGLLVNAVRNLSLARGLDEQAATLDRHLEVMHRRNGAAPEASDEPTNPG